MQNTSVEYNAIVVDCVSIDPRKLFSRHADNIQLNTHRIRQINHGICYQIKPFLGFARFSSIYKLKAIMRRRRQGRPLFLCHIN